MKIKFNKIVGNTLITIVLGLLYIIFFREDFEVKVGSVIYFFLYSFVPVFIAFLILEVAKKYSPINWDVLLKYFIYLITLNLIFFVVYLCDRTVGYNLDEFLSFFVCSVAIVLIDYFGKLVSLKFAK